MLKQGITIILIIISLLFTIGFAIYKALLIEYTIRKSDAFYKVYSKDVYKIFQNNQSELFAYQYLLKELKKNNIVLYNYINPYLCLMDGGTEDHMDVDYIIKQNWRFYSFIYTTPRIAFHSSQYKSIAYYSNTILIHFQRPGESLSDFERLMSKTDGKLYGSEFNGTFNFIIIPNFYGTNRIQKEIDNFIKECIARNGSA